MKQLFVLILLSLFLSGCSSTENAPLNPIVSGNITPAPSLQGTWNLTKVSGGIAGINEVLGPGQIQWVFDVELSSLTVDNQKADGPMYTGVESGSHPYNLFKQNQANYLFVQDREIGRVVIVDGMLQINGNERSDGSGADFYLFTFTR